MGRDLFRRQALILLLLGGAGLFPLEPQSLPPAADRPLRSVALAASDPSRGPLPADDGPAGGELSIRARAAGDEIVERFIREYLTLRRGEIEQSLRRAAGFRRFIAGRLAAAGLPPELLFLPVIESGYSSRAVSRSGAAGLWQLMRNTARPLGIRIDEWVDERRDFWLATEAALRKLKENREQLGDWCLALAAYNHGLGGIQRLVARTGCRDFWRLREMGLLPRETADYVPRFLAVARICNRPGRYGFPLSWEIAPAWDRIELDRSVDLRILARAAQVPYELLREANAEMNYPLTPSGSAPYRLKVPEPHRSGVLQALADPQVALVRLHPHRIGTGDTLYGLARRYGVSVAMIHSYNPEVDPLRMWVGDLLFVPLAGDPPAPAAQAAEPAGGMQKPSPQTAHASSFRAERGASAKQNRAGQEPRLAVLQDARRVGSATDGGAPADPESDFEGRYVVRKGDTLWAIANRFQTTPEALAWANRRDLGDPIRPGDVLRVPVSRAAAGD
jgi:membrane-bound lytic murein transglycosylase D